MSRICLPPCTNCCNDTWMKVYKSRSLDITKFSSYNELRMELVRMFGLKAQLEDSLRSGACILSPEEVQEMRKRGLELRNNVPLHQNVGCEGYPSRQESRNMTSGIASVGTLNF
ncbi:auxin response factor [Striga asiatica]|uniref:Auxin response factor n=1 Tax=Striga asiatica TaxID=4170 RepID=A0A5A7NVQ4_STRAF|nr:auxin response factor [Striga asiatica]